VTGRLATTVVACVLLVAPPPAAADWLLTPFFGTSFSGETTLADLEQGAGKTKSTIGVAFAIMSAGILGIEADFGHALGFFKGDVPDPVVLNSRLTTIMGNVILATPLALTRESLRPYFVAGFGVMQARSEDLLGFEVGTINRDLAAISVGGGAMGFLTENTGLRFDVRYLRALGEEEDPQFPRAGVARLGVWRASVGVTIRLRQ
jgi:hypothetical protein